MEQNNKINKTNKRYMLAVIREIQTSEGISQTEATKIFLRFYRPIKRAWGFEPNVEEFAEKILKLNNIVERYRKHN